MHKWLDFLQLIVCLKLGEDKVSPLFYTTVGVILRLVIIFIMYSRVDSKCHTLQQTVAGALIGLILGNIFFNNRYLIEKYIPLIYIKKILIPIIK